MKSPKSGDNLLKVIILIFFTILFVIAGFLVTHLFISSKKDTDRIDDSSNSLSSDIPKSMMILIEYKDTIGLVNFANEMQKRNITGLLLVSPDFVEANCDVIKKVISNNIEIIGSNPKGVFWDVPYEEQYEIIKNMKERIEGCTKKPLRIVGSKYMASDENTVKVAQELGIPYVIARGTTDTKATVYKPNEYDVKILSISNIALATFKFGSLCDYSFYERSGTPDDMIEELERAYSPLEEKEIAWSGKYHRVTPTTHTNIGGYLQPWMDMWIEFWDNTETDWVNLDEFMANNDWEIPMWQVPTNRNAPYTPEKIRPITNYDDIEKVENPCAVDELPSEENTEEGELENNEIVMFHNGTGTMCQDALKFFEDNNIEFKQVLNTEEEFSIKLNEYKSEFTGSEGVSDNFGYYPIIFIDDRAFSGFDEGIKGEITEILGL